MPSRPKDGDIFIVRQCGRNESFEPYEDPVCWYRVDTAAIAWAEEHRDRLHTEEHYDVVKVPYAEPKPNNEPTQIVAVISKTEEKRNT